MKSSRRDLFIDMVVNRFTSKIIKLRSSVVSASYPKQVWDYLKQGLVFIVLPVAIMSYH